jgi:glycosyltransferase involved in cell wall biosynthesis
VSQWQYARYQAMFGVPADRTFIARNGISPFFENMFPDVATMRTSKPLPPVLCYTSTPFRGLNLLLDAFPRIREAIPGVKLRVFSDLSTYHFARQDDPCVPIYERCISAADVEYHGSVSQAQLASELRSAHCLAYPSTFQETSCITAMEAMAAGCLVATTDLGALPETCGAFGHFCAMHPDRATLTESYAEHVIGIVQRLQQHTPAVMQRQWEQVYAMNQHNTWRCRAGEWEQWLGRFGVAAG